MGSTELPCLKGKSLLKALQVESIQLIDSSSISLWDSLKKLLPGTRTTAGIKFHACFNLLTGMLTWFNLSSTSSSDRKHFPEISGLKGILTIFDLGYFDYGLMDSINKAKGFYLSRVKKNSKIRILLPIIGIGKRRIGESIQNIMPGPKVVDFIGEKFCPKHGWIKIRVVGFWNPKEKYFHWYTTNLEVEASLIYPLYCLRWQIEITFKACKTSLNLNEITTGNANIVMNLLLASILSYLVSLAIIDLSKGELSDPEIEAITPLRVAKAMVHFCAEFISYFLNRSKTAYKKLKDKIALFAKELFDPNYRNRKMSFQRMLALC